MFKKIKRLDTFGTEIKKGGVKHSITFNENVKIDIVENWKELNVLPKDWN